MFNEQQPQSSGKPAAHARCDEEGQALPPTGPETPGEVSLTEIVATLVLFLLGLVLCFLLFMLL